MDVVGLGYCVYDILAIVPGRPSFDDVYAVHLPQFLVDGGGQVGTALTALARLGAKTSYLGVLGDDAEGRWLRNLFLQEGVDVSRLRIDPKVGTNVCLLLVEEATGRRAILCHPRVQASGLVLSESDRATIQSARVLHLDGQFLPAATLAAQWARDSGAKVCYDGNHPRPGLEALLPLVDWLVVAEGFPQAYTGHGPEEAEWALLALGPELLVVTQGSKGCEVWTPDQQFHVPAFPAQVVDTTGAGDAFHGAFIYGMLQGWELRRTAAFANAAAALNCQTLGGRRGLPTLPEVIFKLAESSGAS